MSWLSQATHSPAGATTLAALATLIVGLATAAVALCVGLRQTKAALQAAEAAKKSADAALSTVRATGDRTIATMRLEWMGELRRTIAEYHSILMTSTTPNPAQQRKLSELGTQLDLMLNVENLAQNELWETLDKIYKTTGLKNRQKFDARLMKAGRKVLKDEWERIKREIQGPE